MICKLIRLTRSHLSRAFLRGFILKHWTQKKLLRLEKIYITRMISFTNEPPPVVKALFKVNGSKLRKVLFICENMWEKAELLPELSKICDVVFVDLRPHLDSEGKRKNSDIVCEVINNYAKTWNGDDPDMIFLYARGGLLSEECFSIIRKRWSCPLLGMNLDDKVSFLPYGVFSYPFDNYQKWAKYFDLTLTSCKIASDWYKSLGCDSIYTPQGVHIPVGLEPPCRFDYKYTISFMGSKKLDRAILIEQLENNGIPVTLFGRGWDDAVWASDTASVFRDTQMNLGLGLATPNLTSLKGRDFECPGIGSCYLTTYNWELSEFWDIGKEILCYRNIEELIEMFAWYKKRPEDCLQIAKSAWKRSLSEHTWESRFRKIFKEIGFQT